MRTYFFQLLIALTFLTSCKESGQISILSSEDFSAQGLSVTATSITDGGTGKITVKTNYVPKNDVTFRLKTSSGTATSGTDFAAIDQTYTITAGSTSVSIPVVSFYQGSITSKTFTAEILSPSEGSINAQSTPITIDRVTLPQNEMSDISLISTGHSMTCSYTTTGKFLCWGMNDYKQLGVTTPDYYWSHPLYASTYVPPNRIFGLDSSPAEMKSNNLTTCVRYSSGKLYCWGNNTSRQIQNSGTTTIAPPVESSTVAEEFAVGGYNTCIVLANGTAQCRGDNTYGALGIGTTSAAVGTFGDVTAISTTASKVSVGAIHGCAILTTGALECWGNNSYGQTGNNDNLVTTVFTAITPAGFGANVEEVSTYDYYVCARLQNNSVSCWGNMPIGGVTYAPTAVTSLPSNISQLEVGQKHACVMTSAGAVWCWGNNDYGQLGNGLFVASATPVQVTLPSDDTATKIAAGAFHTCAILQSGKGVCWGNNSYNQLSKFNLSSYQSPVDVQNYQGTALSDFSFGGWTDGMTGCALKTNQAVECFGSNSVKQLGAGSVATSSISSLPVTNLTATTTSSISMGESFICALLNTAGIQCWGSNAANQIGNGGVGASVDPAETPTGLGTGISKVKSSFKNSCALTTTNDLKCWGENTYGSLGTCSAANTPQTITGSTNTSDFGIGRYHMCLVNTSGVVKCWGYNGYGQLGIGNFTFGCQPTPQTVTLPEKATSVALGFSFTCAIGESGKVYCWGGNSLGQIGVDTYASEYTTPQHVSGLSAKAVEIVAGDAHACARLVTGEVECWGANTYWQLGRQTVTTNARSPAKVGLLTYGVTKIHANMYTTCAIVEGGYAKCWGLDYYGFIRKDLLNATRPQYIYQP